VIDNTKLPIGDDQTNKTLICSHW